MNGVKQFLLLAMGLFAAAQIASAQTWTQTSAPIENWTSIASSADGSKLAAVGYGDGIYVSTNSGITWTQTIAPVGNWQAVASSADGQRLVAATGTQYSGGMIYTSSDSGLTWVTNNVPNIDFWISVVSSSDGKKLAAIDFGDSFAYISTNCGDSWASNSIATGDDYSSFGFSRNIAGSADVTRIVVATIGGTIFTSTNSGNNWIATIAPVTNWTSVSSSADGIKLAATDAEGGGIYTSPDGGTTWTLTSAPVQTWYSIASSAAGIRLVAVAGGWSDVGGIYSSTDSGISWNPADASITNWYAVASSADGNKLVAVVFGGGIWTSQTTPAPSLNITPTNSNLKFSWIVPSTNFVLQQSSDLTMTNWVTLTNPPVLNLTNLQNEVTLPLTNGSVFYRLKTP